MQATKLSFSEIVRIEGNVEHYHVPKYQREYVWSKTEWETLMNDIDENSPDYFIGSIIVVSNHDDRPGAEKVYEVVDGQQRLTTLTILLCAIYKKLIDLRTQSIEMDEYEKEDLQIKLNSVRKKIIHKKKMTYENELGSFIDNNNQCFLRIQPSIQNRNLEDYKYIIHKECGLISSKIDYPKNFGNRRFSKAFQYFLSEIPEDLTQLYSFIDKINRLVFIHIAVGNQSDAFVLFETLNNRGIPLTPIDIVKNSILAEMERQKGINLDDSFNKWQELIELIPDFDLQLRFLRQFYNAFKIDPIIKHEKVTKATKSNILLAFERLIKNDVAFIFNEILEKAAYYSKVAGITSTQDPLFNKLIEELNRVGAASSHTLLMFLFSKKDYLEKSNTINEVVEFLIKYYLRRNVTDYPNTRDLDAINIEVIEKVNQKILNEGTIKSGDVISWHLNSFRGKPSTDQQFRISLSGSIYDSNVGMTRYLLWKIDSIYHTREYSPNLWNKTESGQYYLWTIEHIFPEGRNIPQSWINMIGNGDKEETEKIQTEYVHKLGNLTLSAYNSNLSNRSFQTKQNLEKRMISNNELKIGYKNGLGLNKFEFELDGQKFNLSDSEIWTKEHIQARTESMVDRILSLFSLNEIV
jgi:uncharacterized protein with ParB-like and HNH nuclease domain